MYILNVKARNAVKTASRIIGIVLIALVIGIAIIFLKYKPSYKVIISGEEVGYVTNKKEFEDYVKDKLSNENEINVAYVDIENIPEFEFTLIDRQKETVEEELYSQIDEMTTTTYRLYAINLNGETETYVNSRDEAEETVAKIKDEQSKYLTNMDISVQEIYTTNINEIVGEMQIASVETAEQELTQTIEEEIAKTGAVLDGVYFAVKPVIGNITSRYGATEDIRSHAHSGMDIAAPAGTDIVAAAEGTVTFAGVQGGYGNLVIITHENGVTSYYGHCSKIYANVGDEVKAGDLIAAVGMTGEATGNHLHFEIRKDGKTLNPQNYIYK